jgi:hypothetical protein
MRKTVATDHDRNQTCDLGDGSSEEVLERGKASVERRTALSVNCERKDKPYDGKEAAEPQHRPNALHHISGEDEPNLDLHRAPRTTVESVVICANVEGGVQDVQ